MVFQLRGAFDSPACRMGLVPTFDLYLPHHQRGNRNRGKMFPQILRSVQDVIDLGAVR